MHAVSVKQGYDETKSPGYEKRWLGLVFIGISLLVIALDNTILNVAIPSIARSLDSSNSQIQWIVDAYILVFAALLLTMGALGDRFGRKKALQGGLIMFGIGSLGAALAQSTGQLIAARAFLGIGGSVIMPSTLSIISATFPARERPQAIALWAAIFGLGVGIGPVVGGALLEHFEWNALFFVNLPVIAVALVGGAYFLADLSYESAPKADIPGVLLSIVGLFALVYGIVEAGVDGWTASNVLIAFGVAGVVLGAFAWWESHSPNAMLPLELFKNMSFTGANTALALTVFSLFGGIFFLTQYLQTVLGYSALEAGIRLLPQAVALTIMAGASARIAARIGTKYTVALGILIGAGGLFFMSQVYDVDTTYGSILVGQLILASGLGMVFGPATNSIMGSVPVRKAGIGSAMNDTTRELGGALGVAVLGSLLNRTYVNGLQPTLNALVGLPAEAIEGIKSGIQVAYHVAGGILADPTIPGGQQIALSITNAADRAFVDGMTNALLIGAIIMVVAAALVLIILPSVVQRPAEDVAAEAWVPAPMDGIAPAPSVGD